MHFPQLFEACIEAGSIEPRSRRAAAAAKLCIELCMERAARCPCMALFMVPATWCPLNVKPGTSGFASADASASAVATLRVVVGSELTGGAVL